jgi:hypothetical protein
MIWSKYLGFLLWKYLFCFVSYVVCVVIVNVYSMYLVLSNIYWHVLYPNAINCRDWINGMNMNICMYVCIYVSLNFQSPKRTPSKLFCYFICIMKYRVLLEAICLNNERTFALHKQRVRILVCTNSKKSNLQDSKSLKISSLHCKFIFLLMIFLQVIKKKSYMLRLLISYFI